MCDKIEVTEDAERREIILAVPLARNQPFVHVTLTVDEARTLAEELAGSIAVCAW